MAARANYVKVGIFVVIGVVAAIVLAVVVGTLKLRRAKVAYVTYFNEPVNGLDVGAAVKARGVAVGNVGAIGFAPDQEMVEVRMDFGVASVQAMGTAKLARPDLRAQLSTAGLIGARFVSLDLFDPATHPPPQLSFTPPLNYIPSTPSLQQSLQDSAQKTLERLSTFADSLVQEGVVEKTARAAADLDVLLVQLDRTLKQVDAEKLPARTARAIDDVRATVGRVNEALVGAHGQDGLLASAQQAVNSAGEAGRNASAGTRDLPQVLDELGAAASAIRELAEDLQQNPDMLVKGRNPP